MQAPYPQVLSAWDLRPQSLVPVHTGLINLSFFAETFGGTQVVLQRLNPIFDPALHYNIQAVSAALRAAGLPSPELIPSARGALWETLEGEVWRVLSRLQGQVHERLSEPAQAAQAGALLGSFHRALGSLAHAFQGARPGVHDTAAHRAGLLRAIGRHQAHPARAAVEALAQTLCARLDALAPAPDLAPQVIHGDPKAANIIFQGARAHALIDLDTLGRGQLRDELGDALRSWCNPGGEDRGEASFSVPLFAAAVGGYAQAAGPLLPDEAPAFLVEACLHITLELGLRFAADALNERYFGYDPSRFASRSAHNLHRARAQLALAESLRAQRSEAEAAARRLLA